MTGGHGSGQRSYATQPGRSRSGIAPCQHGGQLARIKIETLGETRLGIDQPGRERRRPCQPERPVWPAGRSRHVPSTHRQVHRLMRPSSPVLVLVAQGCRRRPRATAWKRAGWLRASARPTGKPGTVSPVVPARQAWRRSKSSGRLAGWLRHRTGPPACPRSDGRRAAPSRRPARRSPLQWSGRSPARGTDPRPPAADEFGHCHPPS